MKERKLKKKHEVFAEEYSKDFNAARAARTAGYPESSASQRGHDLLGNALVKTKVQELVEKRIDQVSVDVKWVTEQLLTWATNPNASEPARLKALEMLARHVGFFRERMPGEDSRTFHATIVAHLEEQKKKDVR